MKKVVINFENKTISVLNKQNWEVINFAEASIPENIENSDDFKNADLDNWFEEKFEEPIEIEYVESMTKYFLKAYYKNHEEEVLPELKIKEIVENLDYSEIVDELFSECGIIENSQTFGVKGICAIDIRNGKTYCYKHYPNQSSIDSEFFVDICSYTLSNDDYSADDLLNSGEYSIDITKNDFTEIEKYFDDYEENENVIIVKYKYFNGTIQQWIEKILKKDDYNERISNYYDNITQNFLDNIDLKDFYFELEDTYLKVFAI